MWQRYEKTREMQKKSSLFFYTQKVKTSAPSASILQLPDCKTITIQSRWKQMEQMAANLP